MSDRISFSCPECGSRMAVAQQYAGRDGWCRVCKHVLTVPTSDAPAYETVDLDERHDRLERLFRFAATRVDTYKRKLGRARTENETLLEKLSAMEKALERLDAIESRLSSVEGAVERIEESPQTDQVDPELIATIAREEAARVRDDIEERLASLEQRTQSAVVELRNGRDAAVAKLTDQAARISERLDKSARSAAEAEATAARISEVVGRLEQERAARAELEASVNALRDGLAGLRTHIAAVANAPRTTAAAASADSEQVHGRIAAVEQSLSGVHVVLAELQAEAERWAEGLQPATDAAADAEGAGAAESRVEAVESVVSSLTGQVEELRNGVEAALSEWRDFRESAERSAQLPVAVERPVVRSDGGRAAGSSPQLRATVVADNQDSAPLLESLLQFMDPDRGERGGVDADG